MKMEAHSVSGDSNHIPDWESSLPVGLRVFNYDSGFDERILYNKVTPEASEAVLNSCRWDNAHMWDCKIVNLYMRDFFSGSLNMKGKM